MNGGTKRAALFDDPAGRHILGLYRRADSRERRQESTPTKPCAKMFASANIRKEVPVEEQLAQMPFNVTKSR